MYVHTYKHTRAYKRVHTHVCVCSMNDWAVYCSAANWSNLLLRHLAAAVRRTGNDCSFIAALR